MSALGPSAIPLNATVRQRLVRELRDRIITGDMRPGDRCDIDGIAAELRVSRTPVREALLELSYEGLVHVAPRSGITVIGVSPGDVVDSFGILALLSGRAAAWAAERADEDALDELRGLASVSAHSAMQWEFVEANWAFHRAIHRMAHSPRLLSHIRTAVRFVPTNFFSVFPSRQQHAHSEHDEILAAISAHDVEGARAVAERHVLSAGTALAEWLSDRA